MHFSHLSQLRTIPKNQVYLSEILERLRKALTELKEQISKWVVVANIPVELKLSLTESLGLRAYF